MSQILECCIKVVLNLHIDLRYDILFLISDKVNELKALLPTQLHMLNFSVHLELHIIEIVLSTPHELLDLLIVD